MSVKGGRRLGGGFPELDAEQLGVEASCREELGHRPCDGDPLPPPAGQRAAALADQGVVPLRHLLDELVGVGRSGRTSPSPLETNYLAIGFGL